MLYTQTHKFLLFPFSVFSCNLSLSHKVNHLYTPVLSTAHTHCRTFTQWEEEKTSSSYVLFFCDCVDSFSFFLISLCAQYLFCEREYEVKSKVKHCTTCSGGPGHEIIYQKLPPTDHKIVTVRFSLKYAPPHTHTHTTRAKKENYSVFICFLSRNTFTASQCAFLWFPVILEMSSC